MCDDGTVETANHLFFHSRSAMEVWSQFANFMINGDTVEDTWEASSSYYCGNSGTLRHVWITNFMAVLWSLWRQCNEVIFRGKKISPWLVANRAKDDARLWQKVLWERE